MDEIKKILSLCETADDILTDFEKLKKETRFFSEYGLKTCNYFFLYYRLLCKGNKGYNFLDLYYNKDNTLESNYIQQYQFYLVNKKINLEKNFIKKIFELYFGMPQNFRPSIAKYIYEKYKPSHICDPCAGWGGRCLSAMTLNINYTGFDTNIELKEPYDKMNHFIPHSCNVKIIFEDSSTFDFSTLPEYDMIFTSPPYWKQKSKIPVEEYNNMPKYKSADDFYNNFLLKMIKNTWRHLKKEGFAIFNLPEYMLKYAIQIMGQPCEEIPLKIMKNKRNAKYEEKIYVWKKL